MRILLVIASAFALLSGPAFSADLPIYKAPPQYIPHYFNWTGFYGGVDVEWSSGHESIKSTPWPAEFSRTPIHGAGMGLLLGYQRQIGHFVFGIESAYSWAPENGLRSQTFCDYSDWGHCQAWHTDTHSTKLNSYGSTQLRAAWAFDRLLVGVGGGIAYGWMTEVNSTVSSSVWCPPFTTTDVNGHAALGSAVSAFAEYAISEHFALTAKIEHIDLGLLKSNSLSYGSPIVDRSGLKAGVSDTSIKLGLKLFAL